MRDADFQNLPLSILSALDAIVVLMDLNSRFVFSNRRAAYLFGYKNEEELLGHNAFDIPCPAAQFAEYFLTQDAMVRQEQKTFEYLDIHTYADGDPHICFTKKSPFYHEDRLVGTLCFCTEIKSETIQNIASEIIKKDRSFYALPNDRSYVFTANKVSEFSERELECLFYLLRGYSAKEIAKHLLLSHRTVETYIERIKNKAGLVTKSQLIDYALSEGLINYVPKSILNSEFSAQLG